MNKFDVRKSGRAFYSISVIVILTILVLLWFVVYYLNLVPEIRGDRDKIEASEKTVVSIQKEFLQESVNDIYNNLSYIQQTRCVSEFLNSDEGSYDAMLKNLENELFKVSSTHSLYDQVRYIDESGMEVIRVNNIDGEAVIVPKNQLQDKSSRYYFVDTMALEEDAIFQSQLDLNMEKGEVEVPHKPMIRFGIRLFDEAGNSKGILIINYNAQRLLETFVRFSESSVGSTYLLNAEGYYLAGHDEKNFSFMFNDGLNDGYTVDYPGEWAEFSDKLHNNELYQFYDDNGLYTAIEVTGFSEKNHDIHWYIVSNVLSDNSQYVNNHSYIYLVLQNIIEDWTIFILLLVISIFITYFLKQRYERLDKMREMAQLDLMTRTFNRETGIQMARRQLDYAINNVLDYSVCFIDLNELKKVNDQLGHETGDKYIMTTIEILRSCFRSSDQIIRMGGDEFLICLHASAAVVEKNWDKVLDYQKMTNRSGKEEFTVSLSHGVASVQEDNLTDIDALINLADERMYEEKKRIKGS